MLPETLPRPMWMCACIGLPSILLSLNSQQTFPVAGFSRSSTRPRFVAGAVGRSFVPRSTAASLIVFALVAPAPPASAVRSETPAITVAMTALCILLLSPGGGYAGPARPVLRGGEMRVEHALDLRRARAGLDALDDALALHQGDRRHGLHAEALGQLGRLLDVDRRDPQPGALLARQVRHQALHAPRRTRAAGTEEDQKRPLILTHRKQDFHANPACKPEQRRAFYTPQRDVGGVPNRSRARRRARFGDAVRRLARAAAEPVLPRRDSRLRGRGRARLPDRRVVRGAGSGARERGGVRDRRGSGRGHAPPRRHPRGNGAAGGSRGDRAHRAGVHSLRRLPRGAGAPGAGRPGAPSPARALRRPP